MQKINLGVIGASKHFIKRVALPLQNNPFISLHSIGSRDVNKSKELAAQFGFKKSFGSYNEVIEDSEVDLIYIPLANSLHYQYIKLAADQGKSIVCEKPLTLNSEEAFDAISYCKDKKVALYEAFMYKFHPQWVHTKNFIRTQQLGQIQHISITFSNTNLDPDNIRNKPEMGGGALMDVGCYAISVARFLTNKEPLRVISLMEKDKKFEIDSLTSGILDFGKTRATFNVSTQSDTFQRVEIVGTAATIILPLPFNVYTDIPSTIQINTPLGSRIVTFPICDQYQLMFETIAKHLLKIEEFKYDWDDPYKNMIVMDAVRESSSKNCWIEI